MSRAIKRGLCSAVFAALALATAPAAAQDATAAAVDPWPFDVSFSAAAVSDYMFRGITQTDHDPALQGSVEPSLGIFYGGVWASNVDFLTPDPDVEVDLYIGARPDFGPVSMDFGFLRYLYPGAPDIEYSEFKTTASISPVDMLTLGGAFYYSPNYAQTGDDETYLEANASVSLPHDISLSGALGRQMFGPGVGLSDYTTWNVGASYTWKAVTFDLRYSDTDLSKSDCSAEYPSGDDCDARIFASLSVATSFSEIRDWRKAH
jgi:uncharacterized protein (TIGR02001 family)